MTSPRALFRRLYGGGPLHLLGHLAVIAITAYALSIMFEARFAPQPLNLALWILGGAVLHDAVFLPLYGVAWFGLARVLGAGDGLPLGDRLLGKSGRTPMRRLGLPANHATASAACPR